jgi:hypothetical protein
MHEPSEEGNVCDKRDRAHEPAIVGEYSRQMGYVEKGTERRKAIQLVGERGRKDKENIFSPVGSNSIE